MQSSTRSASGLCIGQCYSLQPLIRDWVCREEHVATRSEGQWLVPETRSSVAKQTRALCGMQGFPYSGSDPALWDWDGPDQARHAG